MTTKFACGVEQSADAKFHPHCCRSRALCNGNFRQMGNINAPHRRILRLIFLQNFRVSREIHDSVKLRLMWFIWSVPLKGYITCRIHNLQEFYFGVHFTVSPLIIRTVAAKLMTESTEVGTRRDGTERENCNFLNCGRTQRG